MILVSLAQRMRRLLRRWLASGVCLALLCISALPSFAATEAELKQDLKQTIEKSGGGSIDEAISLNNLAALYQDQSRYAEAEPLYKRSLAIREKTLGLEHPAVATSLNNLATLYHAQGRYTEAEPLLKRSLVINEKTLGPEHPTVAGSLNNLAALYSKLSRYAEAEPLHKRSLAIKEKTLGPEHPDVANSLNNLAALYSKLSRYAEAEPLYKRSLAIREKTLGSEHPDVANSLNNLAELYRDLSRYAEAEPLIKRALAIREKALGAEHPDVAMSLNNLAAIFYSQGRYTEAEPLMKRALAIREKTLGLVHPDVAGSLNNLAVLYRNLSRYAEAEPLLKRSLAIREKTLGSEHPDVAMSLSNLAGLYKDQSRYTEAEPLHKRSLAIYEKAHGTEHPDVATSLNNLAVLYQDQGRYAEAEPLYKRSLVIREKPLGSEHPDVANSLNNLALFYDAQGRYTEALPYSRRAYTILKNRFERASNEQEGELTKAGRQSEQKSKRSIFITHIGLLSHTKGASAASEAFEAAQLAQASSVGQSVAQMAARFAVTGGDLSKVIRQRQDTADQLTHADKALVEAASQPPAKRNADKEAQLRKSLVELEQSLKQQSQVITKRFPEYDALVSPAPITVADNQKLLKRDEALLLYLVSGENSYAWVVRANAVSFVALDVKSAELDKQVSQLRSKLDPTQNPIKPFDTTASYALYQKIFAPLEEKLKGVRHIVLINGGALQSLPFPVLVDKAPGQQGQTSWLADRYAFSVVPSVSSLRALRTFSRAAPGKEPFIGFGNPILQGSSGTERIAARALFRAGSKTGAGSLSSGIADVEQIRKAAALPETEIELRAFAKALKAPGESVRVGVNATETLVKQTDLSRYGVLAFATHGVMAGELSGVAEPGLILTPPSQGSVLDDGYLSASEVAQLKLNADWVLLSACNTAAPDGKPGAEGLSGLAKGFFYAGARSLLVSHWAVESDSAVLLTTEMFSRYENNQGMGKAEALRQSMQKLRQNPKYDHPMYWAPFSVVGEGGVAGVSLHGEEMRR